MKHSFTHQAYKRCRQLAVLSLSMLVTPLAGAVDPAPQEMNPERVEVLNEWREATFGMFVHWGAYSVLGGEWNGNIVSGYAEHILRSQKISLADYRRDVVAKFNPTEFDADEWVAVAKAAGMKYIVITAKHHDGFAMWDSKIGDYDIIDATSFGRDPMRELRDACKRHGLLFGFYYSHAQDWSHPYGQRNQLDFGYPQPDARGWHGQPEWQDYVEKSWNYVNEKSIPQMEELIRNYDPDLMWFDTHNWLPTRLTAPIVKRARELKPSMVINSRGTNFDYDYKSTNDRPYYFQREPGFWEAIPTTNNSYGYHAHDKSHKPASFFVKLIARAAGRGGNLLMNVGPMGNGKIDPVDVKLLTEIGDWLETNSESVYGTERTPLAVQAWGDSAVRGNKLYLHVFDWPTNGKLMVAGIDADASNAYLLADKEKKPLDIKRRKGGDLLIRIPDEAPDPVDTVIVVETKDGVKGHRDNIRLSNFVASNDLHVFEGKLHGDAKGIAWGGGNIKSDFIETWTDPDAYVSWSVRAPKEGTFDVKMRVSATEAHVGNSYEVAVGTLTANGKLEAAGKDQIIDLGQVTLEPGLHTITVHADGDAHGEKRPSILQLTELQLVPVL